MFSVSMHGIAARLNRLSYDQALKVALRKYTLAKDNVLSLRGLKLRTENFDPAQMEEVVRDRPKHFMSNTAFRLGPLTLSATLTTNIFNPGTTTGGTNCTSSPWDKLYVILTNLYLLNKTSGGVTASLWVGATGANAAGTEFYVQGTTVPANAMLSPPWYGRKRFGQADFLVGGAGSGSSILLNADGEIGVGA